ncbi:terminase large subunit [Devosia sp. Root635]|uniref:terminase large subunit n=1 Tax=Devosia sp. Root635 TaxID=1736575 RepID=UPI0009E8DB44|nr:terminase large subunit [Devosia sp. Root635]
MLRWSTACLDWRERIVERQTLIACEPLFPDEADAALAVFKSLRMVDVAGSPTFGEVCEPFVFDFVRAVFGAYDKETGQRLIEEFFLLVSKKNGKSTIVAGIMVTALIRNWRGEQELLILAPTREVADNAFKPAAAMIDADPELSDLLHVKRNVKEIEHRLNKAVLKVISADSSTAAGKKAAFVLIDELWHFGKKAGASPMLQEATGGLISRPEGFVIYISTQSDTPPAGVFKEKLEYARKVRDGQIDDPKFLPVIYEFPEAMVEARAYLDPANFYITNPNIGKSVRREWLERKFGQVQSGEDEEGDTVQTFLAKHLNVEIGGNLRANRWTGADHWAAAEDEELASLPQWQALDRLLKRSEVVVVGADGGGLDDLFGLSVLGREPGEVEVEIEMDVEEDGVFRTAKVSRRMKRWLAWSHAWCHRGVLTRRKSIAPVLQDIAKAKQLTILDQPLGDVAGIVRQIERIKDMGLLGGVAVDASGLGEMEDALDEIGVTQEAGLLVAAPQGGWMMSSIKGAERRLASGLLKHSGGPLMQWCVPNLKIEPTATGIRATKQTAGDAKIDPAMAMFNAVTLMSRNPMAQLRADVAAMIG